MTPNLAETQATFDHEPPKPTPPSPDIFAAPDFIVVLHDHIRTCQHQILTCELCCPLLPQQKIPTLCSDTEQLLR